MHLTRPANEGVYNPFIGNFPYEQTADSLIYMPSRMHNTWTFLHLKATPTTKPSHAGSLSLGSAWISFGFGIGV
jgi:hypothetical protein